MNGKTRRTPGQEEQALQAALRLLTYRARSESEIRAKLWRFFPGRTIDTAVKRLREMGLLDDAAFAHAFVNAKLRTRPRSRSLITRELRARGIDQEAIQAATVDMDDKALAYKAGGAALRKLSHLSHSKAHTLWVRIGHYLRRRGFSSSVTYTTITRLHSERQQGEALHSLHDERADLS